MKKIILLFMALILTVLISIPKAYAFIPSPTDLSNIRTTYSMGWVDQFADNPIGNWYRFHVVRYQTNNQSIYYTHFINATADGFITTSSSTNIDVAIESQKLQLNDTSYWTFPGTSSTITMYVWIEANTGIVAQNIFDNIFKSTSPYYSWVYMDTVSASIIAAKSKALVYLADIENNSYLYSQGYQYGYDAGKVDGITEGYDEGKEYYGLFYNNEWITATTWGTLEYNRGLNNDFDYFEWMYVALSLPALVLNIEIWPSFKLGYFVLASVIFGLIAWVINLGRRGL